MNRLLSHYHYRMPFVVAVHYEELKWDGDQFLNWYVTLPNLSTMPHQPKSRSAKLLAWSGCYIWVIYLFASLSLAFSSLITGIVAILLSPFIAAGAMSAFPYGYFYIKKSINNPLGIKRPAVTEKTASQRKKNSRRTGRN